MIKAHMHTLPNWAVSLIWIYEALQLHDIIIILFLSKNKPEFMISPSQMRQCSPPSNTDFIVVTFYWGTLRRFNKISTGFTSLGNCDGISQHFLKAEGGKNLPIPSTSTGTWSFPPDSSCAPSGLKARHVTPPLWPLSIEFGWIGGSQVRSDNNHSPMVKSSNSKSNIIKHF